MFTVLTRWLLSVRALLVGVVLAQKEGCFAGSILKKFCTVKIAVMGRQSLKLVVSFVGTYHGATSAMHEHLKHKHP